MGGDAAVRDQEGKTPAQLAAALKHKEVFWAMIQCTGDNGSVTDADILPKDARSVRKPTQDLVTWKEKASNRSREPYTLAQVRELFVKCGVLTFGSLAWDSSKGAEDLVTELNTCQSELLVLKKGLLRRVKLVRVRLLAVINGQVCGLVELQSDAWLRARDQKLGKLPCRRLEREETDEEATQSLMQELGVSAQLVQEELVVPLAKSCHVQTRTSMSYPGLETEYIIYESTWKVRAQAFPRAEEIGLPNGAPFSKECCISSLRTFRRQFFWPVFLDFAKGAGRAAPPTDEKGNGSDSWVLNPLRALRRD